MAVALIVTAISQAGAILFGDTAGTFLAAIGTTLIAGYIAQNRRRAPAHVWMITLFFTLTSGSMACAPLRASSGASRSPASRISDWFGTLLTIALGIIVGVALTKD